MTINTVFELATNLEAISSDFELMQTVIGAFGDLSKIDTDSLNIEDMKIRPEFYRNMFYIIVKHACDIKAELDALTAAAYQFNTQTKHE